jgi:hypothetical protein
MTIKLANAVSAFRATCFVLFGCTAVSLPAYAAGGLAVGACVTVKQQPGPAQIIKITPGGYVVQPEGKTASEAMNWQQDNVTAGPCPSGPAVAAVAGRQTSCAASDPDSNGKSALEREFRGQIRQSMERPAAAGADGATTITFQSVAIGAPRAWLAVDSFNFSADRNKPIYDLRVKFTTCVDFRAAIEVRERDQNFQCYTAAGGGSACQIASSSADLTPEKKQYIPKQ